MDRLRYIMQQRAADPKAYRLSNGIGNIWYYVRGWIEGATGH